MTVCVVRSKPNALSLDGCWGRTILQKNKKLCLQFLSQQTASAIHAKVLGVAAHTRPFVFAHKHTGYKTYQT